MMAGMSQMEHENIPALTLGWRLKMALGHMEAQDMAAALEVSRTTVSRWMSDVGTPPRKVFIKQWALITRTDPTWLLTGQHPTSPTSASDNKTVEYSQRLGSVVLLTRSPRRLSMAG